MDRLLMLRQSMNEGRLLVLCRPIAGIPDPAADDNADPDLDEVAAAQLAVDRQVKWCPITDTSVLVEVEPDRPDIARLQRALWADIFARIPTTPVMYGRV